MGSLPVPVGGKKGGIWQLWQIQDCAEGINLFQIGCLKHTAATGAEH